MTSTKNARIQQKKKNLLSRYGAEGTSAFGAGDQIRTDYLVITNDVLYRLSYTSMSRCRFRVSESRTICIITNVRR